MQLDGLATLQHQFLGQLGVLNRELELVALDRSGSLRTDTGLDQLTLIGLENQALADHIVQFAALHALAKDEVEAEIEEYQEAHNNDEAQESTKLFHAVFLFMFRKDNDFL